MNYQFPLLGGILIGISTSFFLLMNGRLVGISGIIGSLFNSSWSDRLWRMVFLLGLVLGGFFTLKLFPQFTIDTITAKKSTLFFGSILVGFGTRLGNGCTSGHGVCGIPRGSIRSIFATIIFISAGIITVYISKKLGQ